MSAPPLIVMGEVIGDPADPGKFIAWDPTLLANPDAGLRDNRGCPSGYAAIYVSDGFGGTMPVCRRLDTSVLGPGAAQTIAEETAPTGYDAAVIAIADASRAVVEAATPFAWGTAALLAGAALLLLAWKR